MTPEQFALVEKAKASLDAARLLADNGYGGFSASRSYDAMFYLAEALLLGKGMSFSKHSAVISAFGKNFIKTDEMPRELHRYLTDAVDCRNAGDYDVKTEITREQAEIQFERSKIFLNEALPILDPPS